MTTSGTKVFELDVADYIEEAFERCGLEVRTGYDSKTARRSLNLLLAEWANRGLNHWTVSQESAAVSAATLSLGVETVDVLGVVVRIGDTDRTLERISREDWLVLPDREMTGQPTQFYVDRQIIPVMRLWPVPDQEYTLTYDRLVRMDDANASTQTVQVPWRFYPCLAAGLAYYISMKRNPGLTMQLKAVYEEEFARAAAEDRDRASFYVLPSRGYRV
jgi:hypothetical protein